MKANLLTLVALLAGISFPVSTRAQIPWWWNDWFTYPGNSILIGQTGPSGLTWVPAGSGAVQPRIQPGNLPVPGLAAPAGNHVRVVAGEGPSARLGFHFEYTNGTAFCSFTMKVADVSGLGPVSGSFAALTASGAAQLTTPTNDYIPMFVRPAIGGYQLGVSKSSSQAADIAWHSTVFSSNQTVFVVGSYEFTPGPGNDTVRLWINPNPATFGASNAPPPALTTTAGPDAPQLASFVLFQRPAPLSPAQLDLDELRIAGDWAGATPRFNNTLVDLKVEWQRLFPEGTVAGHAYGYSAKVSNVGSNVATAVSMVAAHQGVAVAGIAAQATVGTSLVAGNAVGCAVDQLAPNQSVTLTITVTPQAAGKLRLQVYAAAAGMELLQPDNSLQSLVPVLSSDPECDCACAQGATPDRDPLLTSWFTTNSGNYAKLRPEDGAMPLTSWQAGPETGGANVVENEYADVQRILYDADFVYIRAYGLASYVMGPWVCPKGGLFPDWPDDQTAPFKIPRSPDVSPCSGTSLGAIGLWVNGTAIYNMLDGFYFDGTPATGADTNTPPGPSIWNRDAYFAERVTLDGGSFHTAPGGQYHSHASPLELRRQLDDNRVNVTIEGVETNIEQSDAAELHHSPILGWAFDGHPIYGPYGYSEATNSASAITRMRSGYVLRDGNHGTPNLNVTGRKMLPVWARIVQARYGDSLEPDQWGPSTNRTAEGTECNDIEYSIGRYAEDYAYLGHLINPADGKLFVQGEDFDLDLHNGRCCVTPEYPSGTYAYFVTIDSDSAGTPVFPYVLGWQYCGQPTGGEITSIPSGATLYYSAWRARLAPIELSGSLLKLRWSSQEGAAYRVLAGPDLQDWTPISASLPSGGTNTTYTHDPGNPRPPKQFYKVQRLDGAPQP